MIPGVQNCDTGSMLRVVGGTQLALEVMFAKILSFLRTKGTNVAECDHVGVRL